ncbi:spermidine synthase [Actinomadura decatromicini]|uniref:Spermidine synthase n=1 Tax=Actinomadura decatromicini TaxID=2604572 RepID=A0A5D3FAL0_9ACTN|nr:spermidine synthase [Actinomadura decatromicini]TYK44954.1 spermidine synthase [Actinomadura decatromicini]
MGVVPGTSGGPVVVERAEGVGGELVLRRAGADYEIISNGVFLMDTRDGTSERLLVRAAVEGLDGPVRLLIGGLGVGFSLAEALDLPEVAHVTVVEREPAVVDWHHGVLRPWSRGAVDDPRVTVRCADLLDVLTEPAATEPAVAELVAAEPGAPGGGRFDALCLDIDNGPGWTVTPGNARLYSPAGLALLAARLTRRGTLAVWSAAADPAFEALLGDRFAAVEARPVPVPRGEPDVVYLARRPRHTA